MNPIINIASIKIYTEFIYTILYWNNNNEIRMILKLKLLIYKIIKVFRRHTKFIPKIKILDFMLIKWVITKAT